MKTIISFLMMAVMSLGITSGAFAVGDVKGVEHNGKTQQEVRKETKTTKKPVEKREKKLVSKTYNTRRIQKKEQTTIQMADVHEENYELLYTDPKTNDGTECLVLIFYTDNEYCIAMHKTEKGEWYIDGGIVEEEEGRWDRDITKSEYDRIFRILKSVNENTDFDSLYEQLKI